MKKLLLTLFIILSLAFLALGVYYLVTPAGSLFHSLPGYLAGSTHKHAKHGLASLIVGLGFAVLAWFYSAKK
jgi:hypothetical protein